MLVCEATPLLQLCRFRRKWSLERQETGCPQPMSSHACVHNGWQPGELVFCTEAEDIQDKPPVQAMHWQPAASTTRMYYHSSAQGPFIPWWLRVHGADPSHAAVTPLHVWGASKAVTQLLMNITSLRAASHEGTGKREVRGKKMSKLVFCLRALFSLKQP